MLAHWASARVTVSHEQHAAARDSRNGRGLTIIWHLRCHEMVLSSRCARPCRATEAGSLLCDAVQVFHPAEEEFVAGYGRRSGE